MAPFRRTPPLPPIPSPAGETGDRGNKAPGFAYHGEARGCGTMKITAIIHEAEEGGFWAEVPSLPGCMTQGDTLDEVQASLQEAVQGWFEAASTLAHERASQAGPDGTPGKIRILELAF